jgi:hypothetical protein
MKSRIIKLLLVVAIILLSIFLYTVGKQHALLVDNKTVTIDGVEYVQHDVMNVYFDGGDKQEIKKNKRKKVEVVGTNHTVVVETLDADKKVIKTEEFKFGLSTSETKMLINIPALLGGAENWIEINE